MPTAQIKPNKVIAATIVQKQSSNVVVAPKENPAVVIQPTKDTRVETLNTRGIAGRDGKTILTDAGPPPQNLGSDGDYYIDKLTYNLYGPKTLGQWGEGVPLITAGKNLIIVAFEQLIAYRVVTTNEFGLLETASADNLDHANRVVGIVLNSPVAGDTGTVATEGAIINPAWNFIPEKAVFLGLNGELTQDPNLVGIKFSQQLGYAKSANTVMLKIGISIVLL